MGEDNSQAQDPSWIQIAISHCQNTTTDPTDKWSDSNAYFLGYSFVEKLRVNEVRELNVVKVLHTSLLNTTVVAFKVLPLGSYAPMPVPSPPFKTILELVLWNGLQSYHCIIPDNIVIKMPSFQYFLYLREHKKVAGG